MQLFKCPTATTYRHVCGSGVASIGCGLAARRRPARVACNASSKWTSLRNSRPVLDPKLSVQTIPDAKFIKHTSLSSSSLPSTWGSSKFWQSRVIDNYKFTIRSSGSGRSRSSSSSSGNNRRVTVKGGQDLQRGQCIKVIITDFDETCTEKDTTILLAEAALKAVSDVRKSSSPTSPNGEDRSNGGWRERWDTCLYLVNQYDRLYADAFTDALSKALSQVPRQGLNTSDVTDTTSAGVQWTSASRQKALQVFSDQLCQFLTESVQKTEQSDLLEGIPLGGVWNEVVNNSRSILRAGCADTLRKLIERGIPLHIASLNFSRELIKAAFDGIDGMHVHANELVYVEGVSTGDIEGHLHTPVAKDRLVDSIVASVSYSSRCSRCATGEGGGGVCDGLVVFIGDSALDLLALSKADIGIVMGESAGLKKVADALGFSMRPFSEACEALRRAKEVAVAKRGEEGEREREGKIWTAAGSGILYKAQNWSDVLDLIAATSSIQLDLPTNEITSSTSAMVDHLTSKVKVDAAQGQLSGSPKAGAGFSSRLIQSSLKSYGTSTKGRNESTAVSSAAMRRNLVSESCHLSSSYPAGKTIPTMTPLSSSPSSLSSLPRLLQSFWASLCSSSSSFSSSSSSLSASCTGRSGIFTHWLSPAFLPFLVALCQDQSPDEPSIDESADATCAPFVDLYHSSCSASASSSGFPSVSPLLHHTRLFSSTPRLASRPGSFSRSISMMVRSSSMTSTATSVTDDDDDDNQTVLHMPRVLTIAGSDSGSGAGIQADLKACAALGAFCSTVITAITAQNTIGVQGIHPVPASFVSRQMASVLTDIGADVVKTGMLLNAEIVRAVSEALRTYHHGAVVIDPVMLATSGDALADTDMLDALKMELLPLADIVTPNLQEASVLLGGKKIVDISDMCAAAKEIHEFGCKNVLVKGGHRLSDGDMIDILFDGTECHELRAPTVRTSNTHGTGCTLASAIAAELAKGLPMLTAVQRAKSYLTEGLRRSARLRLGTGPQGPINHLFILADSPASFPSLKQLPSSSSSQSLQDGGPFSETRLTPRLMLTPDPLSPRAQFKADDLFLYAVSDSAMNAKWGRSMADALSDAIAGGATFLQLRRKDVDTLDFLKEAEEMVKLARAAGIPLVINDRIDVALASGADGVHIGQSDMPVAVARKLLGPDKIIGVSAKTPEQAEKAFQEGADYLGSGAVYPTTTKVTIILGIEGLSKIVKSSKLPVVAIGGIYKTNAVEVMEGGRPDGVAVVSALFNQPDVADATRAMRETLEACRNRK